jgi:histidyl-tRNA synthetase
MPKKFQTLTGMHDIFGLQYDYFEKVREVVLKNAKIYGFSGVETPIIEDTEVFTRGIGQLTDVVEKEMYSFKTKGGDNVSLRPEGTAPIMRSFIEHGLYTKPQPVKFFYFAPFFRYEKPQFGRYRQFWQFGFETIGKGSPIIDAQIILVNYNILKELGIEGVTVEINNMGEEKCRNEFKKDLKKYLKKEVSLLCGDCKRRKDKNPLRVLDCKKCLQVKEGAPQIVDYICKGCREEFKQVLEFLEEVNVPYDLNPFLIRGLDYYTGTVYEFFVKNKEDEIPLALGGGGRYDGLSTLLGDEERPGAGAALGVERVIHLMKENGIRLEQEKPGVFIAQLGDLAKKKSLKLFEELKKEGIFVAESFGQDSLKSQISRADKLEARITLIIGKEEAVENRVILRDMDSGEQEKIKICEITKEIKKRLKK